MILESIVSVCDIINNELQTVKGLSRMRTIQTGVECLVEEGIDQALAMAIVSSLGNGRTSADVLAEFDIVGGGSKPVAKKTATASKPVAKKTATASKPVAKKTATASKPSGKIVAKKTTETTKPMVIQRVKDYQGHAMWSIGILGGFNKSISANKLRFYAEHAETILEVIDSEFEEGDYYELR